MNLSITFNWKPIKWSVFNKLHIKLSNQIDENQWNESIFNVEGLGENNIIRLDVQRFPPVFNTAGRPKDEILPTLVLIPAITTTWKYSCFHFISDIILLVSCAGLFLDLWQQKYNMKIIKIKLKNEITLKSFDSLYWALKTFTNQVLCFYKTKRESASGLKSQVHMKKYNIL